MFFRQGPDFVSPAHIRAMISDPAVKIVSFDVFDTLLVRPALQPRDIFHLLARRVNALYGVDFIRMRWDAEAELGRINADIHEIYDFMAEKHGLDARTRDALLEEEVRCETTLLSPRPDAKELYDEAVRLGKRVIAVSDMYLPGEIIADILRRKGFSMDAVYVSCDCAARKSDGALYDVVLAGREEILRKFCMWATTGNPTMCRRSEKGSLPCGCPPSLRCVAAEGRDMKKFLPIARKKIPCGASTGGSA